MNAEDTIEGDWGGFGGLPFVVECPMCLGDVGHTLGGGYECPACGTWVHLEEDEEIGRCFVHHISFGVLVYPGEEDPAACSRGADDAADIPF